jgi:uncharacterized protein (DUF58 family)
VKPWRGEAPHKKLWNRQAVRDFVGALVLLTCALAFALASQAAVIRGDSVVAAITAVVALALAATIAFTIVPRLARQVRVDTWLLPLSFSITREGGLYIAGVFLLGLAAINTGNNLLFLILSTLLSAIIASGIVARSSLRAISVSMQVPENVFEGERVLLKVSLRNEKLFLPSFSVAVEDSGRSSKRQRNQESRSDGGILRRTAYFPLVAARESRSEVVFQSFPRRGRYALNGFQISTRFPFGFFRRGETVRAGGEVVVYPSVREVSSFFHLLPFLPGQMESVRVGQGESLYSIRKYQQGESARIVDWKASAKTGELMAREYAREEESRFCLILDTLIDAGAFADSAARFESAVSLAASLAAHFTDEGAEIELLTPREHVPRGMGAAQLYRILRSLALVAAEPEPERTSSDLRGELAGILEAHELQKILSDKIFKVILTSKPRGSFPSGIWRSSHVVYFDEL